ncbi:phage tail protein I [Azospirillum sp.]|uniref:phage tail protein I n=1 Tax=Azospirillum sp. TaxID=34012 RepID=UPI002D225AA8|nr:phage tail protein I [Azospirillum sp.]HYD67001.1 phage tail protein I [Azospirillum sp.]
MTASLLPSNATVAETAIAATAGRLSAVPVPNRDLWNPQAIPAHLLPWLAWSLSIGEEWTLATTEQEQRDMVAAAVDLHRYKGTPFAVRRGLRAAGFRDATLHEGEPVLRHDGAFRRDGTEDYNVGRRWALFSVTLDLGNDKGFDDSVAARARTAIAVWKNARSHLHRIELKATLSEARNAPPAAAPALHVGLHSSGVRAGWRDGTHRRAAPTRYVRDGAFTYGAGVRRDGAARWTGLRFGRPRVQAMLHAGLRLEVLRGVGVSRDGAIRFSGVHRRGDTGALDVWPPVRRVALDDARAAWPEIPGFLVHPDPAAWAEGRPLDGPVYGAAVRRHPRDASFRRDGSRAFGPLETTYYTQQGNTVLQTVWDYDTTQWDGDTTEWDEA